MSRPSIRVLCQLTVVAGLAGSLVIGAAGTASASCMVPPRRSPDAFIGTVIATDLDGRRATVETVDGDTVTVVGTPEPSAVATTVDRTYVEGATYEFHPVNDSDPYEDNACTRTHQLHGAQIPAVLLAGHTETGSPQAPAGGGPEAVGGTDSSSPAPAIVGVLAVSALGLGGGWLLLRRRRIAA